MDIELRWQPITWSNSTPVYHPGDAVIINVPSLGAAQLPTIHIYNAELVVTIDANDSVRVGSEARFEMLAGAVAVCASSSSRGTRSG